VSTIEERLIGYQLVLNTNRKLRNTLELSVVLKGLSRWQTVEAIQETANLAYGFVTKQSKLLTEFLLRYPDQAQIQKALNLHATARLQVEADDTNLVTVNTSIRDESLQAKNMQQLKTLGNASLSAIEENTTELVTYKDHFEDIHYYTSCWDLVNACAIVLQGRTHGTGKAIDTLDERKTRAAAHVQTFFRLAPLTTDWGRLSDMRMALREVDGQLASVTGTVQADTLGADVDGLVPRAPLLRRWWQYGN